MRSRIAEQTRIRQAEREASLSLEERAVKLERATDFALELYMQLHGIGRDEAMRRLRDAGAAGRKESECAKRTAAR